MPDRVIIRNKNNEEYSVTPADFAKNLNGQYDGFKAVSDEFGQPLPKHETPKPAHAEPAKGDAKK